MTVYLRNSTDFSADCSCTNGQCLVARENFHLLDDGKEADAIDFLQRRCGNVVIIPNPSDKAQAWLYHTSCDRMADAVRQIFRGKLDAPTSVHRLDPEMTTGELHRQRIEISIGECRAKIEGFSF